MDHAHSWIRAIQSLRRAADAPEQLKAIQYCSAQPIKSPSELLRYMDALLFVLAFPYNVHNYQMAETERNKLTEYIKGKMASHRWQQALEGSGLPYTILRCQFSADLAWWFLHEFPKDIRPDETQADPEYLAGLMQSVLPGIEFHDATKGRHSLWSRVRLLSGHQQDAAGLLWLLKLIRQQSWTPALSDILYDQLKIFIRWDIRQESFARPNLRLPFSAIHYRKPGIEKADSLKIINQPVGKPIRLTAEQKHLLIVTARISLACYFRETDPVTYADPEETFFYDMGGGLQIAVMGMNRNRVLALESYVGFMAFMNGIPVSYGGGWIFGYRCKIGVNIYPPFRGAGSDHLFCQVLRLYYQLFRVQRFVVKPYQFGKGNPEGLKSGAFWFYYRLGFRPVRDDIRQQAAAEWEKIRADKSYRTDIKILRQFTACNKEWEPVPSKAVILDADQVSIHVSRMLRNSFKGDRAMAVTACCRELSRFLGRKRPAGDASLAEKAWTNWALLISVLPDKDRWSADDKKRLYALIQTRISGAEHDFIRLCQQHKRLWRSLSSVID